MADVTKPRFKFLKKALKYGATGGIFTEFDNFQKGVNKLNRHTTANYSRAERAKVKFAVLPFGVAGTGTAGAYQAADGQKITMSARTNTWRLTAGITDAEANLRTREAANKSSRGFFIPANLIVAVENGTATDKISGITKQSYKYIEKRSYSIPFGQGDTELDAFEKQVLETMILTIPNETLATATVTSTPERFFSPDDE